MITPPIQAALCALALTASISNLYAAAVVETFGSGANAFSIEFVDIGNPGNGDDLGAGGGQYSSPFGGVPYNYRMAVTEVPQDWITKATNLGLANVTAGAWTGNQPAANITWSEAAAFVNFLNTSTGHQPAYDLTFNGDWTMALWSSAQAWQVGGENRYRHKDAYYFLPSEDEWYKAAYHKNDGVTANYWDYATGSNISPTRVINGRDPGTAVYASVPSPATVDNNGGLSPYGTRGQNGNVLEKLESAFVMPNDNPTENRSTRGGDYINPENGLRSSFRGGEPPDTGATINTGFRVASVPEPSTAVLLIGSSLLFSRRRSITRISADAGKAAKLAGPLPRAGGGVSCCDQTSDVRSWHECLANCRRPRFTGPKPWMPPLTPGSKPLPSHSGGCSNASAPA